MRCINSRVLGIIIIGINITGFGLVLGDFGEGFKEIGDCSG